LPRVSAATRARQGADSFMIIIALATFGWYFLLGPNLLHASKQPADWLVPVLYPCVDLLLLCYLILAFQRHFAFNRGLGTILIWMAVAALISTILDAAHMYLSLAHQTTGAFDHFTSLIYLALGGAWQMGRLPQEVQSQEHRWDSSWVSTLLPYAFVVLILLLLCWIWFSGETGGKATGTEIGGFLLIGTVLLRQVFAMRTIHETNQQLARLSTTDALTGLPNHRSLLDTLETELERSHRSRRPLSIVFFDGDRFKRVNDTYGHAVGDAVLRELGTHTRSVLQAKDTLGRYGGEEFLAVLPDCDKEQAVLMAERMRAAVAASPLASAHMEGGICATISVGVAVYPTDGATGSQVIELADQAMYWAKRLGRNQVCTSADVVLIYNKMTPEDMTHIPEEVGR
jgi:diguanylate cyclase (GGDEF)-like protein